MSAENYRSASKSHDPGWNDPPKLGYSPGVASGQPPKLNLNKRIAFPMAGTGNTTQPNLPPPPAAVGGSSLPQFIPTATSIGTAGPLGSPSPSVPPLPPMVATGTPPRAAAPNDKSSANAGSPTSDLPTNDEMKHLVEGTLEEFLLKTDSSRQGEIRKRLDLMLQGWTEAKLSDGLIGKLYRLAQALNECKAVEANEIHRSIIVEHGKECVLWAPALRQLIQAVPKQEENLSAMDGVETKEPIVKPL